MANAMPDGRDKMRHQGENDDGRTAVTTSEQYSGCLPGGTAGEALGASLEFISCPAIHSRFDPEGITDYAPVYGGLG